MNDVYVSEKELSKQGVNAVFGIGGGVALMVLGTVFTRIFPPIGLGIGCIVSVLGLSGIFSKDKEDRKGGLLITAIGAVLVASKFIPMVTAFTSTILSIGAFASFGLGIWNGIRFLSGLKSRK